MAMKIYAKQVPPEHQESPMIAFDEYPDDVVFYGNRHYKSHTTPAFDKLDVDGGTREEIAEMLTEVTGVKYEHREIRGCCQGDWQVVYYPQGVYSNDMLRQIEAEYFNTGTEWCVHDGDDKPEAADDFDGGFYTYCYDNPREEIAKDAGVKPEEVALWEFIGHRRVAIYKEVV